MRKKGCGNFDFAAAFFIIPTSDQVKFTDLARIF